MRFTKMQGCGNDYIYVDCFAQPEPANPAELSKRISDRHFGIGSDGLILILPSKIADARMRMFNADGSQGEMCGNGIRCVAKYLVDRGIVKTSQVAIETNGGVRTLETHSTNGKVAFVCVDMGEPIFDAHRIPTTLSGHPPRQLINVDGHQFNVVALSMGNPHAVIFDSPIDQNPAHQYGLQLEVHEAFPDRVNVHFVQLISRDEVIMQTWERGSGITLACGTGACAVCVAGVLTNRTNRKILAHLPGGDLHLDWSEIDNHVYMTGPAVEVFSGEWPD